MLGLRFCARAFSSCGERGPLFIVVRGPLTVAASLVAEHRLQMCRLSSCGSRAQLLRGMWDLPRPGLEPVSPALAGKLSNTAPPGKPVSVVIKERERQKQRERQRELLGTFSLMLTHSFCHVFNKCLLQSYRVDVAERGEDCRDPCPHGTSRLSEREEKFPF